MKFLLLLVLIPSAFSAFYVSNSKVMSEVQIYSKGEKKIVLIDMFHVGPRKFYLGVKSTLSSYTKSNSVILKEGVMHCLKKGDELILPTAAANFSELENLYYRRNSIPSSKGLEKLQTAGFVRARCNYDSSNEEPQFLDRFLSRFSFFGIMAGIGRIRSQSSLLIYPKDSNLQIGDIASGRFENPIMKALAGSIVECMLKVKTEDRCIPFKAWAETENGKKLVDEFIVGTRNDILIAKTLTSLGEDSKLKDQYDFILDSNDHNVVILPWGAAHMPQGLTKSLEAAGFKKNDSEKKGIEYTSCSRLRKNLVLGMIFQDYEEIISGCK